MFGLYLDCPSYHDRSPGVHLWARRCPDGHGNRTYFPRMHLPMAHLLQREVAEDQGVFSSPQRMNL